VVSALTAEGASRASAVAVVGVLGDQAGGHPRLAEDHLDERVHRFHLTGEFGNKTSRRTHQQ
jgi:hypothetical protein